MEDVVWRSGNGVWTINRVWTENGLTLAECQRFQGGKRKHVDVMVEHIRKGETLLWGEKANRSYDNFVANVVIPKYLEQKIIEFSPLKEGAKS
jgi:hypothetical protein